MENNIFLRPAVAGLLAKGFVESRHHVDLQSTLTKEQFVANRKLRDEIAGTAAMPYFVIVDPQTGEKLGEGTGPKGNTGDALEENFIAFLKAHLK